MLERGVTVSSVNGNDFHLPDLATSKLPCEAVGMEGVLGKFEPVVYLAQPTPRYGGSTRFFEANRPRTFKVYQGVNEIAARNKFLGEYEIVNTDGLAQELNAMIGFQVSAGRELLLVVTDMTGRDVMKVRRIDASGQK